MERFLISPVAVECLFASINSWVTSKMGLETNGLSIFNNGNLTATSLRGNFLWAFLNLCILSVTNVQWFPWLQLKATKVFSGMCWDHVTVIQCKSYPGTFYTDKTESARAHANLFLSGLLSGFSGGNISLDKLRGSFCTIQFQKH